jgi:hypothetical protein
LDVSKRGITDESTKKMSIYIEEENSTKDMPFEILAYKVIGEE